MKDAGREPRRGSPGQAWRLVSAFVMTRLMNHSGFSGGSTT